MLSNYLFKNKYKKINIKNPIFWSLEFAMKSEDRWDGLLELEMKKEAKKWTTEAKRASCEQGVMWVTEAAFDLWKSNWNKNI